MIHLKTNVGQALRRAIKSLPLSISTCLQSIVKKSKYGLKIEPDGTKSEKPQ